MSKKHIRSAIATAIGASFLAAAAIAPVANAAENPFALKQLDSGYKVAEKGSCGKGSCGAKSGKDKKGKGSCGAKDKSGKGNCSAKTENGDKKGKKGSCGKGSCAS